MPVRVDAAPASRRLPVLPRCSEQVVAGSLNTGAVEVTSVQVEMVYAAGVEGVEVGGGSGRWRREMPPFFPKMQSLLTLPGYTRQRTPAWC